MSSIHLYPVCLIQARYVSTFVVIGYDAQIAGRQDLRDYAQVAGSAIGKCVARRPECRYFFARGRIHIIFMLLINVKPRCEPTYVVPRSQSGKKNQLEAARQRCYGAEQRNHVFSQAFPTVTVSTRNGCDTRVQFLQSKILYMIQRHLTVHILSHHRLVYFGRHGFILPFRVQRGPGGRATSAELKG
ncbi:uncharacterized protein BO66DRAFT_122472 [Aspergillus aculeatinus CBS 121060]|uniref:Uncharacterized protein n=1 Tax=Aspergillus aculeatinus CBS 121060 TaxID=1448322 RepID=A0ACD1H575_9EURO|nr:hypothetical protein BO66DRAFT_122472 [Aspergillus aculeatinus CBS 121060]RAH68882.1 hypothetical protein BO66DRAFT_122472 [Aspergillus aculeatinus CBS 121060]